MKIFTGNDAKDGDELLYWLSYNFPGVYRRWCNKLFKDELVKKQVKKAKEEFRIT